MPKVAHKNKDKMFKSKAQRQPVALPSPQVPRLTQTPITRKDCSPPLLFTIYSNPLFQILLMMGTSVFSLISHCACKPSSCPVCGWGKEKMGSLLHMSTRVGPLSPWQQKVAQAPGAPSSYTLSDPLSPSYEPQ